MYDAKHSWFVGMHTISATVDVGTEGSSEVGVRSSTLDRAEPLCLMGMALEVLEVSAPQRNSCTAVAHGTTLGVQ